MWALVFVLALLHHSCVAEVDVEALLQKMSLQQKIGQLMLNTFLDFRQGPVPSDVSTVDVGKLSTAFRSGFGPGHIYGPQTPFSHSRKLGGLCSDWINSVQSMQQVALSNGGIPILFGLCSQHGPNYIANATIFPQNIGAGATFNRELVWKSGVVTGTNTRTCGLPWAISPAIDIALQPQWARHYECFSDDPYLSAMLADALVRGIESNEFATADGFNYTSVGKTQAATILKHFIGYSTPDSTNDREDATIPDWVIERYHLPAFRSGIAAGAAAVMANSGSVDGVPGHASTKFLVDLLRKDLNFTGLLVSDYADVGFLVSKYKVARNFKEATKIAMDVGLDVTMIPEDWGPSLLDLVNENQVPVSRIDQSVRRILRLKDRLGLFESSYGLPWNQGIVGDAESRALALAMAEESLTLLKNSNATLPIPLISTTGIKRRILVTGPTSNSIRLQAGGWTIAWQGANNDAEFYGHGATISQAIQGLVSQQGDSWEFHSAPGCNLDACPNQDDALAAAKQADYIVVALGEKTYAEMQYNLQNLDLQAPQLDFVIALRTEAPNAKIILVMVQGRPRLFSRVIPSVDAIIYAYLPGPYGGPALANILFGLVNPSGRLPFSYPTASRQLALQYGNWAHSTQWPFGFGLSYTTFSYSELTLASDRWIIDSAESEFKFTVTVTNNGPLDGKEAILAFISETFAYPNSQSLFVLKRFLKVEIPSGKSGIATFVLQPVDMRYNLPNSTAGVEVQIQVAELRSSILVSFANPDVVALISKKSTPDALVAQTTAFFLLAEAPLSTGEPEAPAEKPSGSPPSPSPSPVLGEVPTSPQDSNQPSSASTDSGLPVYCVVVLTLALALASA